MSSSFLQRLLMASATALLVVGVAGAAVHEDEADDALASARDGRGATEPAGGAPSSAPVTTTATTSPLTSIAPPAGFAVDTPAVTSGSADTGAASGAAGIDSSGATASGSGLAATGNGGIASGGAPLADTGSYPLSVPGALLLVLGGAGRILLRTASRRTG